MRCESPVIPQEISFRIKKCLGSRKGWKIFPEDDDIVGEMDTKALKTVVNMIKELECQVQKLSNCQPHELMILDAAYRL